MPHRDPVRQDAAQAWVRIIRDTTIIAVAVFLFVYGAITVTEPTILTIFFGAAMALLGIPPYLRREQWGRNGENGNGVNDERNRPRRKRPPQT